MECEGIRAALSARLDGEEAALPEDVVDAHLDGCEECQRWYSTVTALGRQLRMTAPPEPAPQTTGSDAAARVLDAAESIPNVTGTLRARQLPLVISRIALAFVAAVYVGWAAVLLFGSTLGLASTPEASGAAAPYGAAEDPVLARFVIDAATSRFALGAGSKDQDCEAGPDRDQGQFHTSIDGEESSTEVEKVQFYCTPYREDPGCCSSQQAYDEQCSPNHLHDSCEPRYRLWSWHPRGGEYFHRAGRSCHPLQKHAVPTVGDKTHAQRCAEQQQGGIP